MTTIIDFTVSLDQIANVARMTPEARTLIRSTDSIRSSGFQELVGCNGRKAVWSAGARFCELTQTWHLSSLGDGAQVKVWAND